MNARRRFPFVVTVAVAMAAPGCGEEENGDPCDDPGVVCNPPTPFEAVCPAAPATACNMISGSVCHYGDCLRGDALTATCENGLWRIADRICDRPDAPCGLPTAPEGSSTSTDGGAIADAGAATCPDAGL